MRRTPAPKWGAGEKVHELVNVTYDKFGKTRRLTMTGHADYAKDGQPDIVCAACSAILYTLLGWMGNNRAGYKEIEPIEVNPGAVKLYVGSTTSEFDAVFDATIIGLKQVAMAAPESVRIA